MASRPLLKPSALPFRPGPVLERLPWRTHAAAERVLPEASRRRLEAARAILTGGWERPFGGVVHALEAAFPELAVLVDAGGYDNSHIVTNVRGSITSDPFAIRNHDALRKYRSSMGLRSLENRPVNSTEVLRGMNPNDLDGVWKEVFLANEVTTQMRLLTSGGGERHALFALFRRPRRAQIHDFDIEDQALLHALTPSLLAWTSMVKLLGLAPIGTDAAIHALDLVDSPVWFVHQDRLVAYANAAARARYEATPRWVLARAEGEAALGIVRAPLGGSDAMTVVTQRAAAVVGADSRAFAAVVGLPVYLARVAMGLREGLADKEIAARTGLSLRTVRTYVTRVMAHEKVTSRRALIARWRDV